MLLAGAAELYLYQVKHRTRMLELTIEHIEHDAAAARARTELLRAEYAVQNDPNRLQDLASHYLALQPIQPSQFVQMSEIARHLPAVPAPEPAAQPAAPPTSQPIFPGAPTPADDAGQAVVSQLAPTPENAVAASPPPALAHAAPVHAAVAETHPAAPERHVALRRVAPPPMPEPVRYDRPTAYSTPVVPLVRPDAPALSGASVLGTMRAALPPPVPVVSVSGWMAPRDPEGGR